MVLILNRSGMFSKSYIIFQQIYSQLEICICILRPLKMYHLNLTLNIFRIVNSERSIDGLKFYEIDRIYSNFISYTNLKQNLKNKLIKSFKKH